LEIRTLETARARPLSLPRLPPGSTADRWADVVVRAVVAPGDPKTLDVWGRAVALSRGTLRGYCYAAGVSPKRALDFTRLLRAVVTSEGAQWEPAALVDVADLRTMKRLFERGGLPWRVQPRAPLLEEFLTRQTLVDDSAALVAVRERLSAVKSALFPALPALPSETDG
jgi:hypothetical protein